MPQILNHQILGSANRIMLADIYWPQEMTKQAPVILCHGFKGFKDWGHYHLLGSHFINAGIPFVKFNFSHNGTTVDQPFDFADLEAFGNNNFSKELDDLGNVIDTILSDDQVWSGNFPKDGINLMGHSRGGGTAILKTVEDQRVKKMVTWASVMEFGRYFSQAQMDHWKKEGVIYIENSRTNQQMPLYWQAYENYYAHLDRLNLEVLAAKVAIPTLVIHGSADPTVAFEDGQALAQRIPGAQFLEIANGDHSFGAAHPWESDELPEDAQKVIKASISFFIA